MSCDRENHALEKKNEIDRKDFSRVNLSLTIVLVREIRVRAELFELEIYLFVYSKRTKCFCLL